MLKAVIFDMDGVLIDTEPTWRRIELATYRSLGLELDETDIVETMGVRLPEAVDHWYARRPWPEPDVATVTESILAAMVTEIGAAGEPAPGAVEALRRMRDLGLATAIASSSAHRLIDAVVARLGIGDLVDVRCSADDDGVGKPDPAVYLRTAAVLKVAPGDCLAIEDSLNGMRSALAAGMACCVIPDPSVARDPGFDAADLRIASLHEVTGDVVTRASRRTAHTA